VNYESRKLKLIAEKVGLKCYVRQLLVSFNVMRGSKMSEQKCPACGGF